MRLIGKVALITGAARGLGRTCAIKFAKQGANLILVDICKNIKDVPYNLANISQLEYTAKQCQEYGISVLTCVTDIRKQAEIDLSVLQALNRFGKIDILVNNAGIVSPSGKIVHNISESEWDIMININLTSTWRVIKSVGLHMSKFNYGSIINISSTAGHIAYRNFSSYVTSKHALIGLSKSAALDYASKNIRVNTISPGSIHENNESKMLQEINKSLKLENDLLYNEQNFINKQPMNRLVSNNDIANACVWLASDETLNITGSNIVIDGGFSIK